MRKVKIIASDAEEFSRLSDMLDGFSPSVVDRLATIEKLGTTVQLTCTEGTDSVELPAGPRSICHEEKFTRVYYTGFWVIVPFYAVPRNINFIGRTT